MLLRNRLELPKGEAPAGREGVLVEKTLEQLRELAADIVDGKVFTTNHIRPEDVRLIPSLFIPLAFADEEHRATLENVAMVYEYIEKAGPRSVNGYPAFFSCKFLTKEEYDVMQPFIRQYAELKKQFFGGQSSV